MFQIEDHVQEGFEHLRKSEVHWIKMEAMGRVGTKTPDRDSSVDNSTEIKFLSWENKAFAPRVEVLDIPSGRYQQADPLVIYTHWKIALEGEWEKIGHGIPEIFHYNLNPKLTAIADVISARWEQLSADPSTEERKSAVEADVILETAIPQPIPGQSFD